jgi:hypothetical protein
VSDEEFARRLRASLGKPLRRPRVRRRPSWTSRPWAAAAVVACGGALGALGGLVAWLLVRLI